MKERCSCDGIAHPPGRPRGKGGDATWETMTAMLAESEHTRSSSSCICPREFFLLIPYSDSVSLFSRVWPIWVSIPCEWALITGSWCIVEQDYFRHIQFISCTCSLMYNFSYPDGSYGMQFLTFKFIYRYLFHQA
jgi:hypothetical protein